MSYVPRILLAAALVLATVVDEGGSVTQLIAPNPGK